MMPPPDSARPGSPRTPDAQASRPARARWILTLGLAFGALISVLNPARSDIIDDSALPSVGEPVDQVLTRAEEARIKRFLKIRLYGHLPVSEDPESNVYIRSLGALIRARAGIQQEFDILIVRDHRINAFAMPGGLLAFHTGLMTQARNESELAGVIGHEMAHVTQRHMARMYAHMTNSNLSILTTAGIILAGIFQTSALLPTMVVGQAAEVQRYLNYSRANEQEADRIASQFLAKSGISPHGVANFFEVLLNNSEQRLGRDFEYLSTHPITTSRITEAQDRARQYKGKYLHDREVFHFIRERMISLHTPSHERLELYRDQVEAGQELSRAQLYGYAVAFLEQGDPSQALKLLQGITETKDPELILLLGMARAQAHRHLRQIKQSLTILEALNQDYPKHPAVEFYLAQTYLDAGKPKPALKLARSLVQRNFREPQTYRLLAEAADATRQPVISHIALADYYLAKGQLRRAAQQLEIAEKRTKADSANRARIEHRRVEIQVIAKELY